MMHVAPGIGIAETAGGLLISLPPRFWLVVSLKRTFRKVVAGAEPWTYLIRDKRPGRKVEEWIAAVELDVVAEARRRAWTATDAEWSGSAAQAPSTTASRPVEPVVVEIPPKGTARSTLKLIRQMQAGQIMVVTVPTLKSRSYRLSPSGRIVQSAVAERAIEGRYLIPSCDGLFGPDWSQTWSAPAQETPRAAKKRSRKGSAGADQAGRDGAASEVRRAAPGGTSRRPRPRAPGEVVGHGRGRSLPRRCEVMA